MAIIGFSRQKFFRMIGGCAGAALMVSWFWIVILENDFVNWPRKPQPEIGRTVPYSVESITVYVSPYEQALVRWLTGIAIVSGMAGVICLLASGDWRLIINPERKVPGSNG
jgi:hypothetical protein